MQRHRVAIIFGLILSSVAIYFFWTSQQISDPVHLALKEGNEVLLDGFTSPLHLESDHCEMFISTSGMDSPLFFDSSRLIINNQNSPEIAASDYLDIRNGKAKFILNEACPVTKRSTFVIIYELGASFNFSNASKLSFAASDVDGDFDIIFWLVEENSDSSLFPFLRDNKATFDDIFDEDLKRHAISVNTDTELNFDLDINNADSDRDAVEVVVFGVRGTGQLSLGPIKLLP